MPLIRHCFISPGHNYFGHHGKPAGEDPIVEVDSVHCVAGSGIEGDRFFNYKADYKGQITFFDWAVYAELRERYPDASFLPSAFRRNIITEGLDLNALIGKTFALGDVVFAGTQECSPCYWMDQAVAPGTEAFLKGRGGLRARILRSGVLSKGPSRLNFPDSLSPR